MFEPSRRSLLMGVGALSLPLVDGAWRGAIAATVSERRPLWRGDAPGGGGPSGPIAVSDKGAVSNVAVPMIEIVRPARPNGAAVLVAGGGGYKRIEMASEAMPAAHWLAAHDVTAYLLTYRLPGEGWRNGAMAPLQDAQRAIRLMRAETRGPVGLLGFSAGGHLLGLAATRSVFASYQPQDAVDKTSARVDEVALIYPVVTLEPPFDHTSTRVQLIGRYPSVADAAKWSVETHVQDHCPPMFLVQAEDDPISNIVNTAMLADACRAAGVPVERHVLPSGGHGFGMGRPGSPTAAWPGWYKTWLRANSMRV
ncbi:alpha/beta hydrolase [Sphingomonas sp. PP-CE-1G-424]|uniref:alpha/beta hydrolase n=1 Tax=Sphingomonas sp. PP-CE-1G-424 TaxID=2135658 RepID=UPI0010E34F73|nr:alpha/beta hydrolase [Sphingomonas sp. PP-CE-1G-424]TCP65588.1 acetyl esterase/lipase [Sphingomonas sp. PP-CE-1G-424]